MQFWTSKLNQYFWLDWQNEKLKVPIRFSIKKLKRCKISLGVTISESSSNQKSNHKELQYMSILLLKLTMTELRLRDSDSCNCFAVNSCILLPVKHARRFQCALHSVWSYKKIYVKFWFRAQTGYWLELEPSNSGNLNLTHQKYSLVNLKRGKRPTWS